MYFSSRLSTHQHYDACFPPPDAVILVVDRALTLCKKMLPSTFLVLDFLVLVLLYAIYRAVRPQCSSVPLPPGPKASWLGSLSLPSATEYPWRVYSKWRETYGVFYMSMPLPPSSNVLQAMSSTSMSSEILLSFLIHAKPQEISLRIRVQSIHHVLAGQWSMNCKLGM